ncbi:caspase family protein [Hahella aquimaris]|uniref:caspase family protein n=1 Tax=Hahella sp. HNIBRBA332 TaxID=3015983 RepID=UPI00273C020E|nr:caspase family protein [Hahella sp. HNIBRBA332]WLQ16117.1 caspase family protein [Hahella sp. HNIBRBA332]
MASNDYAILVGISRYADPDRLPDLQGPVRDVELMRSWLTSPSGGDVPATQVIEIVSDETGMTLADLTTRNEGDDSAMPPLFQDFFKKFLKLVSKPDRSGYVYRDSRLYLYFSGHGFCEKYRREAHAALFVGNSSPIESWNIYGTYFAQWTKDQGLFSEIVLIMDCCRDAKLTQRPMPPPLPQPTNIGASVAPRLFELYGAPRGGKAQERAIAARNGEVHGLLTHAFLDALEHAEWGKTEVPSQAVKNYLESQWRILCEGSPADPPEVVIPSNGEIYFQRKAGKLKSQRFKVKNWTQGERVRIVNGQFEVIAELTLMGDQVKVKREAQSGGDDSEELVIPVVDGEFELPLPVSLLMATGGAGIQQKFETGGDDVEL